MFLNFYATVLRPSVAVCRLSSSSVTLFIVAKYDTIRYDTIEEFNVDSKAEYTA